MSRCPRTRLSGMAGAMSCHSGWSPAPRMRPDLWRLRHSGRGPGGLLARRPLAQLPARVRGVALVMASGSYVLSDGGMLIAALGQ